MICVWVKVYLLHGAQMKVWRQVLWVFSPTVNSRNGTHVISLAQQVLLPTDSSHWSHVLPFPDSPTPSGKLAPTVWLDLTRTMGGPFSQIFHIGVVPGQSYFTGGISNGDLKWGRIHFQNLSRWISELSLISDLKMSNQNIAGRPSTLNRKQSRLFLDFDCFLLSWLDSDCTKYSYHPVLEENSWETELRNKVW